MKTTQYVYLAQGPSGMYTLRVRGADQLSKRGLFVRDQHLVNLSKDKDKAMQKAGMYITERQLAVGPPNDERKFFTDAGVSKKEIDLFFGMAGVQQ